VQQKYTSQIKCLEAEVHNFRGMMLSPTVQTCIRALMTPLISICSTASDSTIYHLDSLGAQCDLGYMAFALPAITTLPTDVLYSQGHRERKLNFVTDALALIVNASAPNMCATACENQKNL
jgi:hypothetical protein